MSCNNNGAAIQWLEEEEDGDNNFVSCLVGSRVPPPPGPAHNQRKSLYDPGLRLEMEGNVGVSWWKVGGAPRMLPGGIIDPYFAVIRGIEPLQVGRQRNNKGFISREKKKWVILAGLMLILIFIITFYGIYSFWR
ncbi:unnamed protein product [Orchesella dallaii]|uniref:Uncharacterized protein n=1 Tax=Orchesella dallaii TaxID=48710 RepID=A0ABP1RYX7_9HEXA